MDAYQYALMKETLERIQKVTTKWIESDYEDDFGAMYEIETILLEVGFHE